MLLITAAIFDGGIHHRGGHRRLAGAHGAADSDSASCVVAHNFIFLFVYKFILFSGGTGFGLPRSHPFAQ